MSTQNTMLGILGETSGRTVTPTKRTNEHTTTEHQNRTQNGRISKPTASKKVGIEIARARCNPKKECEQPKTQRVDALWGKNLDGKAALSPNSRTQYCGARNCKGQGKLPNHAISDHNDPAAWPASRTCQTWARWDRDC